MTTTFVPADTTNLSADLSANLAANLAARGRRSTHFVRTGVVTALAASAGAAATAGIAYAAGVRFVVSGSSIPISGFATLTVAAVALGTIIAAVLARRARHPRHTFIVTTLVLTALTFVPDVLADAHVATKLTLMLTHVVAAAIAIPLLARRLTDCRLTD